MGLKVYWMLNSSLLGLIGSNRFLLYRQHYAVLLIFGFDTPCSILVSQPTRDRTSWALGSESTQVLTPGPPGNSQGLGFKDRVRDGVVGCVISSGHSSNWLVVR